MQETAYEMRISDWSSDVCSSDLDAGRRAALDFVTISAARPGCYAWSNSTTPRSFLKPSESPDLGGEVVDALAAPARRSCGRLGLPVARRRACRRTRAPRGAHVPPPALRDQHQPSAPEGGTDRLTPLASGTGPRSGPQERDR